MIHFFACGGTGGHIFPALATAQEIRRRDPSHRVFFLCGRRDIENEIFRAVPPADVLTVDSAPYRGLSSFADPRFLIRLAKGFFQARAYMRKWRPGLVTGFGGYVAFPVIWAAASLGIRTTLHEQNARPGRSNRYLAGLTRSVALSYPESALFFPGAKSIKVTGNPIRPEIETGRRGEAMTYFGFSPHKKTLLVLGGSQGAESVNRLFLDGLEHWSREMKDSIQVLHLCGRMSPDEARERCQAQGVTGAAFSFFDRMELAYAVSDLCVGRAGATFLAEIAYKDIPAVLVPYPHGDAHQKENARIFAKTHPAWVEEQATLTPERLARLLEEIFKGRGPKAAEAAAGKRLNAREQLADFLEECASR